MRFMKTFQTSVLTVLSLSFVLSVTCALQAQTTNTWTNFIGDFRWGTTINWSPNGSPNADGAVADFQVTVPNDISVAVVKANGGTLTTCTQHPQTGRHQRHERHNLHRWRREHVQIKVYQQHGQRGH